MTPYNKVIDLELIKRRLNQAYLWGNDRFDMDNLEFCLRSDELMPDIRIGNDYDYSTTERYQAVEYLASKREALLSKTGILNDKEIIPSGRLLCFCPRYSFGDGFVAIDSENFIDDQNCPPWDTWLLFSEYDLFTYFLDNISEDPCLLCWIPQEAFDLVNMAMVQDANQSLSWAVHTEAALGLNVHTMEP